jgi:UDP-galactopyranose mutase
MKNNTCRPNYVKLIAGPEGEQLQAACEVYWAAEKLIDTHDPTKKNAQAFVNVVKTHFVRLVEFKECHASLPEVCTAELVQVSRDITDYYPSIYPVFHQETQKLYDERSLRMQTVLPLVLSLL